MKQWKLCLWDYFTKKAHGLIKKNNNGKEHLKKQSTINDGSLAN
jgi:ribosomal protein L35